MSSTSELEEKAILGLAFLASNCNPSLSSKSAKSLTHANQAITLCCMKLGFSVEIESQACTICANSWTLVGTQRFTIAAVAGTCVAMALRAKKQPIPLQSLAKYIGVNQRKLNKCYQVLSRGVFVETSHTELILIYCEQLMTGLGMATTDCSLAKRVLDKLMTLNLKNRQPRTVATTVVCIVSQLLDGEVPACKQFLDTSRLTRVSIKQALDDLSQFPFTEFIENSG